MGKLSNLKILTVNDNYLVGSLPPNIGDLTKLEVLWTSINELTGVIPNQFGNLVNLITLIMHHNFMTGTLPASFGRCSEMDEFKLSNMGSGSIGLGLSGTIPSELGNMTKVKRIILNGNILTGSIPSSIGLLPDLIELDLSKNMLSGSLPATIGNSPALEILALNSNRFYGNLPPLRILSLGNIFIQDNKLSGKLEGVFFDPRDTAVTHIDVSNNLFSGKLPPALFHIPNISSLALSGNCFSGSLPKDMCGLEKVQVLSLNGLGASSGCKDAVKSIFSKHVILYNTMSGSLPECVWNLPKLRILHATGNGLHGKIPELSSFSVLENVGLAHNYISGTIPVSVQERSDLVNLDLSFNSIGGEYYSGMLNVTANVTLEVNRLSGKLQPSHLVTTKDINILRGNIFSCGCLPSNDEHIDLYSCGSQDLDFAIYTWVSMVGVLGIVSVFIFAVATFLHPMKTAAGDEICGVDFKERRLFTRLIILARNVPFYSRFLGTLDGSSGLLLRIHCFDRLMANIRRYWAALAALCIALCFVLIAFKFAQRSGGDVQAMTHTHLYSWMYSLAYMSGQHIAAIIIVFWVIATIMFFTALLKVQEQSYRENEKVRDSMTSAGYEQPHESIHGVMEGKTSKMVGLIALNLLVVGFVNTVYINLLSGNTLTPTRVRLLQLALAAFRMMYSLFCVPALCGSIENYKKSVWVRIRIYVVNSIFIPIIVAMRSSPSCMQGLFEPDNAVGSVYTYDDCTSLLYDSNEGISECVAYTRTEVEVAAVVPPFLYHYQCSSVVLTSYIPVFIYTYMFRLLLPFGVIIISLLPYTSIPKIVSAKFPGIFWPDYWVTHDVENLTDEENDLVQRNIAGVASGRKLLSIKSVIVQVMQDMCVLLTFGLCSPLLAVVVTCASVTSFYVLRIVVSRFVHYRLRSLKDDDDDGDAYEEGNDSVNLNHISAISQGHDADYPLCALSEEFKSIVDMLMTSQSIILVTSNIFFMVICFDIVGDISGWENAMWVIIAYSVLFIAITVFHKYRMEFHVEKPLLDTGLYPMNPSSLPGVEMGTLTKNPVASSEL